MAEELMVPFLGEVPLEAIIAADGDYGVPTVAAHPGSPSPARPTTLMAMQMASQLSIINDATAKVTARPKEVDTKDPSVTVITWEDDKVSRYPNRYLAKHVPLRPMRE